MYSGDTKGSCCQVCAHHNLPPDRVDELVNQTLCIRCGVTPADNGPQAPHVRLVHGAIQHIKKKLRLQGRAIQHTKNRLDSWHG